MQDADAVAVLELDRLQNAYKAAVEEWISAIKQEEGLASVNHTVAEIDQWEAAHFKEDDIRTNVKAPKKQYEDACAASSSISSARSRKMDTSSRQRPCANKRQINENAQGASKFFNV
jgi:hypothetical protein